MWRSASDSDLATVSNPFLPSTPDAAVNPQVGVQPGQPGHVTAAHADQQQAHQQAAQQDSADKAMAYVAEMRAQGHGRTAIVTQLTAHNIGESTAEYFINQADLFAGMMGRPHPMDIDPQIKAQIDAEGPMMVTESLAMERDPLENNEEHREAKIAQVRQMAESGAERDELVMRLIDGGAPADQAQQIVHGILKEINGDDDSSKKKRRGFLRKSKE